jgi:hypothetical protein
MLKSLRVAAVVLVLINPAWAQVVGNGGDQNKKATSSPDGANSPGKFGNTASLGQDASSKQTEESKRKPYPWGELIAPANMPNWILAVIGGCAVLAALKTLWAIKRQADLMERQIALSINQQRPRLHLEPQPYTAIINSLPDIRIKVTNIGGSKAIFGLCIAGMEATSLEVDVASRKPINSAMLKGLTSRILDSGDSYEDRIDMFSGAKVFQIFPPDLDKSAPYKMHIFGVLNFRDIISEDTWYREFHYSIVSMKNVYMVQFGKMSSEVWTTRMLEADRRIDKPVPPIWIRRVWGTLKAWQAKIDAED